MATKKIDAAAPEQTAADDLTTTSEEAGLNDAQGADDGFADVQDEQSSAADASAEPEQGASELVPDAVEAPAALPEMVDCRVLSQCQYGSVNAVVSLPWAEAHAAFKAGQVDPTPAAVAYARSL
ncbi:hypothetical protein JCM19000A_25490 [Silvimonas sp. JCM 19000]